MYRFWKTRNLASAAEAARAGGEIAGLKPCAAANLEWAVPRIKWAARKLWRECGAAEIAEAALVLPILFAFIMGVLQFGRLYLVYSTMQHAAQEGARAAAGGSCATCGNSPIVSSSVATTVVGPILQNAHIDAAVFVDPGIADRNACGGGKVSCDGPGLAATPRVCVQRNVILNEPLGGTPASGMEACGASVALAYPLTFSLPAPMSSPPYVGRQTYVFNLKAQAQVKGEN